MSIFSSQCHLAFDLRDLLNVKFVLIIVDPTLNNCQSIKKKTT